MLFFSHCGSFDAGIPKSSLETIYKFNMLVNACCITPSSFCLHFTSSEVWNCPQSSRKGYIHVWKDHNFIILVVLWVCQAQLLQDMRQQTVVPPDTHVLSGHRWAPPWSRSRSTPWFNWFKVSEIPTELGRRGSKITKELQYCWQFEFPQACKCVCLRIAKKPMTHHIYISIGNSSETFAP